MCAMLWVEGTNMNNDSQCSVRIGHLNNKKLTHTGR